jgi:hypothetical protein
MKLCKEVYIDYEHDGETYTTQGFVIREVVRHVMESIPAIKTTSVDGEGLLDVKDAYTKEQFEDKCLKSINKHYILHGELNEQSMIPTKDMNWITLINGINSAYYQLKNKSSRFQWRTYNGYRIKLDYDGKTPPQIFKGLALGDAQRIRNVAEKNMQRETTYLEEANVMPLFVDENKKFIDAIDKKLLKGGY